MEEINLEKIKDNLVGLRDQINKMIEFETQKIERFEKVITTHYTSPYTEEEVEKMVEEQKSQADKDNKEIDEIWEKLKDNLRSLGISEKDIEEKIGSQQRATKN